MGHPQVIPEARRLLGFRFLRLLGFAFWCVLVSHGL